MGQSQNQIQFSQNMQQEESSFSQGTHSNSHIGHKLKRVRQENSRGKENMVSLPSENSYGFIKNHFPFLKDTEIRKLVSESQPAEEDVDVERPDQIVQKQN